MANNLKKDLLLVEVELTEGISVVFRFLNEDEGLLYEVTWNLRKFDPDNTKWVKSEEQEQKVAEWAKEYFGVEVAELANLGDANVYKDVYHYDTFNSLWEIKRTEKMPKDRVGEIFTVEITEVEETSKGFLPKFEEEGKTYGISGFDTSTFLKGQNKFFKDPVKEEKTKAKFLDRFGISLEDKDTLVGEEVMVEIKQTGAYTWIEGKKFTEAKKNKMKEKAGK